MINDFLSNSQRFILSLNKNKWCFIFLNFIFLYKSAVTHESKVLFWLQKSAEFVRVGCYRNNNTVVTEITTLLLLQK